MSMYRYYDTPDGYDLPKKTYYLLRPAMNFGLLGATYDSIAMSRPLGTVPVIDRFIRVFVRPLVAVTLWSTTTYAATRIRGKDDGFNHAIGWMPVAYYLSRHMGRLLAWATFFPVALLAFGCKEQKRLHPEMTFFPEITRMRENLDNTLYADYFIYTFKKIMDKNWYTLEEAIKKGIVSSKEDALAKGLLNYEDGMVRGLLRTGDGTECDKRA